MKERTFRVAVNYPSHIHATSSSPSSIPHRTNVAHSIDRVTNTVVHPQACTQELLFNRLLLCRFPWTLTAP